MVAAIPEPKHSAPPWSPGRSPSKAARQASRLARVGLAVRAYSYPRLRPGPSCAKVEVW